MEDKQLAIITTNFAAAHVTFVVATTHKITKKKNFPSIYAFVHKKFSTLHVESITIISNQYGTAVSMQHN
jgi:BarA-like signal transduction histidine kinase